MVQCHVTQLTYLDHKSHHSSDMCLFTCYSVLQSVLPDGIVSNSLYYLVVQCLIQSRLPSGTVSYIQSVLPSGIVSYIRSVLPSGTVSYIQSVLPSGTVSYIQSVLPSGTVSNTVCIT